MILLIADIWHLVLLDQGLTWEKVLEQHPCQLLDQQKNVPAFFLLNLETLPQGPVLLSVDPAVAQTPSYHFTWSLRGMIWALMDLQGLILR